MSGNFPHIPPIPPMPPIPPVPPIHVVHIQEDYQRRGDEEKRQREAQQRQREARQRQREAEERQRDAQQRQLERQRDAQQRQLDAQQRQREAEERQRDAQQRQLERQRNAQQRQLDAQQRQREAEERQRQAQQRQWDTQQRRAEVRFEHPQFDDHQYNRDMEAYERDMDRYRKDMDAYRREVSQWNADSSYLYIQQTPNFTAEGRGHDQGSFSAYSPSPGPTSPPYMTMPVPSHMDQQPTKAGYVPVSEPDINSSSSADTRNAYPSHRGERSRPAEENSDGDDDDDSTSWQSVSSLSSSEYMSQEDIDNHPRNSRRQSPEQTLNEARFPSVPTNPPVSHDSAYSQGASSDNARETVSFFRGAMDITINDATFVAHASGVEEKNVSSKPVVIEGDAQATENVKYKEKITVEMSAEGHAPPPGTSYSASTRLDLFPDKNGGTIGAETVVVLEQDYRKPAHQTAFKNARNMDIKGGFFGINATPTAMEYTRLQLERQMERDRQQAALHREIALMKEKARLDIETMKAQQRAGINEQYWNQY